MPKFYKLFFINKYRSGIPFTKNFGENLVFWLRYYYRKLKYSENRTILVYPEFPSKKSLIWKIAKKLDYNLSNNPNLDFVAAVHYNNETVRTVPKALLDLKMPGFIVNLKCNDISKTTVDAHFKSVFAYCTEVDPLLHRGPMVMKSNGNAMHDGKIINGPLEQKDPEYIYQILIDNTVNEKEVLDLRLPYVFGEIPFVYKKIRPISERFSNTNTRAEITEINKVFSSEELEKLVLFCKKMNIDHGELDVLRDKNNGKIYVVDVNNTPYGPPNHLDSKGYRRALNEFSIIFKEKLLKYD